MHNRNTGLAGRELVPFSSWTKKNDIAPLKRKLSRLLCHGFIYSRCSSLPFKYCLCADHTRLQPANTYFAFILLYQFNWDCTISNHVITLTRCSTCASWTDTYTEVQNQQIIFLWKNTINFLPQNSPITCFLSNTTFSSLTKQKFQMVPFIWWCVEPSQGWD